MMCFTEVKKVKEIIKNKKNQINNLNVLGITQEGKALLVASYGKDVSAWIHE